MTHLTLKCQAPYTGIVTGGPVFMPIMAYLGDSHDACAAAESANHLGDYCWDARVDLLLRRPTWRLRIVMNAKAVTKIGGVSVFSTLTHALVYWPITFDTQPVYIGSEQPPPTLTWPGMRAMLHLGEPELGSLKGQVAVEWPLRGMADTWLLLPAQ